MAGTLTTANSTILLAVASIFPVAQQIQGYAAEDIFDSDEVEMAEVSMGLDNKQSYGYIPYNVKWRLTLQANSASIALFDAVIAAERVLLDKYQWTGMCTLPGLSKKWAMSNGVLTRGKPIPDAKKILQPMSYEITCESVLPAPM